MKIENPKVTLADEARNGVEEEVRSGFLDWLLEFNVEGDNGEIYALGGSILRYTTFTGIRREHYKLKRRKAVSLSPVVLNTG